jgi:hypothetical protein
MKKYTSLFALLAMMTLLIIETIPQYRVFSQSPTCRNAAGAPIPCPPPGNQGGPQIPGPKNRKPTPTPVPPTPTLVPYVHPFPYLYPHPAPYGFTLYPTPIPHLVIPNKVTCNFVPCWVYDLIPHDPIELLAGGGFIVFVVVIAFVFFRGRMNSGGR